MEDITEEKFKECIKSLSDDEKKLVENYLRQETNAAARQDIDFPDECPECESEMMKEWICHSCGFPNE